jgi:hypothetical protein
MFPLLPSKIMKIFLIDDFFHLPPVANLELRISPRIFEKIETKKLKAKNLVTLTL